MLDCWESCKIYTRTRDGPCQSLAGSLTCRAPTTRLPVSRDRVVYLSARRLSLKEADNKDAGSLPPLLVEPPTTQSTHPQHMRQQQNPPTPPSTIQLAHQRAHPRHLGFFALARFDYIILDQRERECTQKPASNVCFQRRRRTDLFAL